MTDLDDLVSAGLEAFSVNRLEELTVSLEERALETGLAAPLLVAAGFRFVIELFDERDESGGVPVAVVRDIDVAIRRFVPLVEKGDPLEATQNAKFLRDRLAELSIEAR